MQKPYSAMEKIMFTFLISCFGLFSNVYGQFDIPINVIVEEDQVISKDNSNYRIIRAEIIRQLCDASQLYNLVERKVYDEIVKERRGAQKLGDAPYITSILNGAAQLINIAIINYQESWDSTQLAPPKNLRPRARPVDTYEYNVKLSVKYRIQVIDLATTEIKGTRILTAKGANSGKVSTNRAFNKYKVKRGAWEYLKRSIYVLNRINILDISNLKIPVIEVSKEKKGEAQQILVVGGTHANYMNGLVFKIVKESKVNIRGVERLRAETIGEVRVSGLNRDVAKCAVLKGGKEIFEALKSKKLIYGLFSERNKPADEWYSKPDKS